jgi:hypothetical protein
MVRPARCVTRIDEPAQLVPPADELTALTRAIRGPLDGKLDVVRHERERTVRIRTIEELEVSLEEGPLGTSLAPPPNQSDLKSFQQKWYWIGD